MGIVYGPVPSWRLNKSLGVDLICLKNGKACPYDCVYCQLGKTTDKVIERKIFVDTDEAVREVEESLDIVDTDIITFSGTGDPTLAHNLSDVTIGLREILDIPLAILTNSALMDREDVRQDLYELDEVVGSLDASNEELFKKINKPHDNLKLESIIDGMKEFRDEFDGKFSLETMFTPENKEYSSQIAEIVKSIDPDEIQINTPLRSSPIKPLTEEGIDRVMEDFQGMNVKSVYDARKFEVKDAIGRDKLRQLKRHE